MNWGSWSNFWAMGGYGLYVWGSYAVTIALIIAEIALLRMRRRAALDTLRQHIGAQS
ncbi:MAG: heme exporter protein CcmD [Burkholderiales bacterium]|nr:heme exporter protein CcmD [Burkholderiales bacterium]